MRCSFTHPFLMVKDMFANLPLSGTVGSPVEKYSLLFQNISHHRIRAVTMTFIHCMHLQRGASIKKTGSDTINSLC